MNARILAMIFGISLIVGGVLIEVYNVVGAPDYLVQLYLIIGCFLCAVSVVMK